MQRLYEVARTVLREAMSDRLGGEAAKVAYFFFLSFFPSILALFAFTGIFGGDAAFEWIMRQLRIAMPGAAAEYLAQFVGEITRESRPGLLSLGIALTVWSASSAFAALADGLHRMYDLEDSRPWWQRRVLALGILVCSLALLNAGAVIVLAGPELFDLLSLAGYWDLLRWPVAFALLTAMMFLVYLLLPNRRPSATLRPPLVGALLGAGLWVAGTLGFRLYVANFASYSKTYGVLGGLIVLLLWLYLSALAILFGGEVSATLEQRARDDWEVGEAPPEAR